PAGVFVLTQDERLAQIDPATGRIERSMRLPASTTNAVAPVTGAIQITKIDLGYQVTITLRRGQLMPISLLHADNHIVSRPGALQLWESGITAATPSASRYGLEVT